MIKPDMIPDEVWHTAMSTYHKTISKRPGHAWQVAIAAALNAWPGMQQKPYWDFRTHEKHTELILPVPQKEKGGQ